MGYALLVMVNDKAGGRSYALMSADYGNMAEAETRNYRPAMIEYYYFED